MWCGTSLEVSQGTNHSLALGPTEGLGAGKTQGLARLVLGRAWIFGQTIASRGDCDSYRGMLFAF